MRNVVASIVIIGFLLFAAIINLLAAFMSRRKLKTQVAELTTTNEKLAKDLSTANSAFRDMEEQVGDLRGHLTASEHSAKQANLRALQEINQKDEFYKLHKESERKLAELAWLSNRANEQAKDISAHVVIKKVKLCALNLTASPRHIIVALTIRNESIFDITIQAKKLTGCIFFNNKSREESARIQEKHRSAIENLEPKQEEILVVEQPLLKSEAETLPRRAARRIGSDFMLDSGKQMSLRTQLRNARAFLQTNRYVKRKSPHGTERNPKVNEV